MPPRRRMNAAETAAKEDPNSGESSLTASSDTIRSCSNSKSNSKSNRNNGQSNQVQNFSTSKKTAMLEIPYKISLPLLVMLDMVGVSLVVPLLHNQYFKLAGVTDASQREWLSSVFSLSQIVGGIGIGALSDSQWVSRRTILLTSFAGSAFAYAMILEGGLPAILISRVTVGLVKQTMTVTSSMMAHATHGNERAIYVGRLNASVTVAFIVGPSAGAYLFSHVGTYAPIYVSCSLFLINILLVILCLAPEDSNDEESDNEDEDGCKQSNYQRLVSNFKACFNANNPCLVAVVSAMLLFRWVEKTTDYKDIATYYENRYGTEPHQRGYLQSYQSALTFVVQSSLVRPILHYAGGEVNAAVGASLLMAVVYFLELRFDFIPYLVILCPLKATSVALLGICLKSVISQVSPRESLGSVFATIDVLQNAAQVTVPFYRTFLFSLSQPDEPDIMNDACHGDPDPYRWLMSSGIHWVLASVAFAYLLWKGNPCAGMNVGKLKES